jgi:chromosome segregation ATPase
VKKSELLARIEALEALAADLSKNLAAARVEGDDWTKHADEVMKQHHEWIAKLADEKDERLERIDALLSHARQHVGDLVQLGQRITIAEQRLKDTEGRMIGLGQNDKEIKDSVKELNERGECVDRWLADLEKNCVDLEARRAAASSIASSLQKQLDELAKSHDHHYALLVRHSEDLATLKEKPKQKKAKPCTKPTKPTASNGRSGKRSGSRAGN